MITFGQVEQYLVLPLQASLNVHPAPAPANAPTFHRPRVLDRAVFRQFAVPSKTGMAVGEGYRESEGSSKRTDTAPMFNPDRPDALVLPRPPYWMQGTEGGSQKHPIVDVVVDPHLSSRLRTHQREGVVFLYRCVMGFGGKADGDDEGAGCSGAILADEMGLGKTLQTITLVWTLLRQGPWGGRPVARRAIVLAPSSLVGNWQAEFAKWLGRERITVFAVDSGTRATEYIKCPQVCRRLVHKYIFSSFFGIFLAISCGHHVLRDVRPMLRGSYLSRQV